MWTAQPSTSIRQMTSYQPCWDIPIPSYYYNMTEVHHTYNQSLVSGNPGAALISMTKRRPVLYTTSIREMNIMYLIYLICQSIYSILLYISILYLSICLSSVVREMNESHVSSLSSLSSYLLYISILYLSICLSAVVREMNAMYLIYLIYQSICSIYLSCIYLYICLSPVVREMNAMYVIYPVCQAIYSIYLSCIYVSQYLSVVC